MPNNLTDAEIKKALKEILEIMLTMGDLQKSATISKTLDLINRKEAEIERLRKENKDKRLMILQQQQSIEYLKGCYFEYKDKYKTAKAEAYKECIEKAKSEIDNKDGHIEEGYALRGSWDKKYFYDSEIEDILDNLLKETVGDSNG